MRVYAVSCSECEQEFLSRYEDKTLCKNCRLRQRRAAWLTDGLCGNCGKRPFAKDRKRCAICLARANDYDRQRTKRLRDAGVCRQCAKRSVITNGKGLCADCSFQAQTRQFNHWRELRSTVIAGYNDRYACCRETEPLFLELDHVNNDGHVERRLVGNYTTYRKARDQGFPSIYQVLCSNCNHSRARNGGVCPHKAGRADG
jgi:hypothetical protein